MSDKPFQISKKEFTLLKWLCIYIAFVMTFFVGALCITLIRLMTGF